jgi:hypothetical protein
MDLVKEVLEAEFQEQILTYSKTFLPVLVNKDKYLLNPINDTEINPAYCSIIKAKAVNTDFQFHGQESNKNSYVIGVLADGLENLRKILDAIYVILTDMDVKNYIFLYKNSNNDLIVSDSGSYKVASLSTEYQVSKTINDKDIIYGSLVLEVDINEKAKFNTYAAFEGADITHKLGANEIELQQNENI